MIEHPTSDESSAIEHIFHTNSFHAEKFRDLIDRSIATANLSLVKSNEPNTMLRLAGSVETLMEIKNLIRKP